MVVFPLTEILRSKLENNVEKSRHFDISTTDADKH